MQKLTVGEMVDMHLAAVDGEIAPGTFETYQRARDRIPSSFADRQVVDGTAPALDGLYRQLVRDGWTAHQLHRLHAVLGVSWTRAVRYGLADVNPVRFVARPLIDPAEIHPPGSDVIGRLLAAGDPTDRVLVRLAASTGARRGELVGLQWDDVRCDTAELVIRRSLSWTRRSGMVERSTKTGRKGQRVISFGPATVAELRRHRTDQVELAVASGSCRRRCGSCRSTPERHRGGRTTRPAGSRSSASRPMSPVSGSTIMRHWVATEMLAAGHSPTQVAGRLGHTNPSTTTQVYANWVRAHDQTAAEELDRRIG